MRKLLFLAALSPAVRWALAALAGVMVVVAVLLIMERPPPAFASVKSALGLQRVAAPKGPVPTKPICSQVIVPAGDCIPQHLANLPPDPGPAGMKTLEGIDSDKDGVRDDVQRFIVERYGESERAVAALMKVAKTAQLQMLSADTIDRDGAKKLGDQSMRDIACLNSSNEKLIGDRAVTKVALQVMNTPQRLEKAKKFDVLAAMRVYEIPNASASELCGYDPAKFAN